MQRRPSPVLIATFLLGLSVLLTSACSTATAGTPECCENASKLIGQMDDCCVENLGKPTSDMTGCCTEGMKPDATDRPECCATALKLRSEMAKCCQNGMKSADTVCCAEEDTPKN